MQDCFTLNDSQSNCTRGAIQLNSSSGGNPGTKSGFSPTGREAFLINVTTIPVEASIIVLLALAVLINGFVLTAMFKVSSKTLQAKFLLISNLIANVTFSLASKLPTGVAWLCKAYGLNDPVVFTCFELTSWLVPPFAIFAQGFCSLSLACDRVYAVCFPLVYKIKGYNKPVKFVIILAQLSVCVGLLLPAVILPLRIQRSPVDLCTRLITGYYIYTRKVRAFYMFTTTVVTFAVYTFTFVYLKCTALVKESGKHGEVSRKMISLTIVYFVVHLTTVLLSAPLALYLVYLSDVLKSAPIGDQRMTVQLLLILVLFSSIVDPIFLTWKIPAIRKKLPFRLNLFAISSSREATTFATVTSKSENGQAETKD